MQRKAFTLIELLVVIAIIAILAAILFPVFAQAKLAAKKTAALSGIKQLGLATVMYINDYDGEYPQGFQATSAWTGNDLWCQRMMPYVKNLGVFGVSTDSLAGQAASVGTWAGVGISFAVNSYYGNWCCSPSWSSGFQLRGPMGIGDQVGDDGYGWLDGSELNESAITQSAATISIAEKHGQDMAQWNTTYNQNGFNYRGNFSNFANGATIGGSPIDGIGWGPEAIPNGQSTAWKTQTNGTSTMFEYGVNGAVSASYAGQSNFAFLDGHAKSMVPSATDPDPVNQGSKNMWDGLR